MEFYDRPSGVLFDDASMDSTIVTPTALSDEKPQPQHLTPLSPHLEYFPCSITLNDPTSQHSPGIIVSPLLSDCSTSYFPIMENSENAITAELLLCDDH